MAPGSAPADEEGASEDDDDDDSDSDDAAAAAAVVAWPAAATAGGRRGGRRGAADGDGDGAEFDPDRLRAYELNKLKYFFAVVTCDGRATAAALYAACDGMEVEASSNVLDLRFVPDDTPLPHAPRDAATDVPPDYAPPHFYTAALQSSNVELTWDAGACVCLCRVDARVGGLKS